MERWWLFFCILISTHLVFSAVQKPEIKYQTCIQASLKKKTPQERDLARFECIDKKWPSHFTFSSCVLESSKFEYLMNEELSLKNCFYTKSSPSNIKNCLTVANRLHSVDERDDMRLRCAITNSAYKNKLTCYKVAESLEQIHLIKKFNPLCYEN